MTRGSLSLRKANYSYSGYLRGLSKFIIILVMIRGRHRGLPVAIDRAVLINSGPFAEQPYIIDGRGDSASDYPKPVSGTETATLGTGGGAMKKYPTLTASLNGQTNPIVEEPLHERRSLELDEKSQLDGISKDGAKGPSPLQSRDGLGDSENTTKVAGSSSSEGYQ